jgi:hypothetical protein
MTDHWDDPSTTIRKASEEGWAVNDVHLVGWANPNSNYWKGLGKDFGKVKRIWAGEKYRTQGCTHCNATYYISTTPKDMSV